jgi:hypothetical protein
MIGSNTKCAHLECKVDYRPYSIMSAKTQDWAFDIKIMMWELLSMWEVVVSVWKLKLN